jgi:DNA-binding MarR family transcriptional regulator
MKKIPEPQLSAWRALLAAHAASIAHVERALAEASLPPLAWYDVLWPLYGARDRRLRMGELAAEVVTIGRTGLSRLVDRLEAEDLLRREPVAGDRRGSYAVLTEEGVKLLRRMWPVYAAAVNEHFAAVLSVDEARRLSQALRRVAEDV